MSAEGPGVGLAGEVVAVVMTEGDGWWSERNVGKMGFGLDCVFLNGRWVWDSAHAPKRPAHDEPRSARSARLLFSHPTTPSPSASTQAHTMSARDYTDSESEVDEGAAHIAESVVSTPGGSPTRGGNDGGFRITVSPSNDEPAVPPETDPLLPFPSQASTH